MAIRVTCSLTAHCGIAVAMMNTEWIKELSYDRCNHQKLGNLKVERNYNGFHFEPHNGLAQSCCENVSMYSRRHSCFRILNLSSMSEV